MFNDFLITKVYAQTGQPIANLGSTYAFGNIGSLGEGLGYLVPYIFSFAGTAVVIYFIVGAIKFVFSGGDKNAIASGQQMIIHAIIGFIILIMLFVIILFIPEFLGIGPLQLISRSGGSQIASSITVPPASTTTPPITATCAGVGGICVVGNNRDQNGNFCRWNPNNPSAWGYQGQLDCPNNYVCTTGITCTVASTGATCASSGGNCMNGNSGVGNLHCGLNGTPVQRLNQLDCPLDRPYCNTGYICIDESTAQCNQIGGACVDSTNRDTNGKNCSTYKGVFNGAGCPSSHARCVIGQSCV